MTKTNCLRAGCKDVFNAFLVEDADYAGYLELPIIKWGIFKPEKLIEFSKAISFEDFSCWVHFYEDDNAFERIWRNPKKYLPILKKFSGVITPDFSLYRDMPLAMQHWNLYRSRAIGNWLQKNGVNVIPNVRFGDERTFECCCYGVPKHGTIAIGTHGCVKNKVDRSFLKEGLGYVVSTIKPVVIVVYGSAPEEIFDTYRKQGITILQFDSSFANSRKGVCYGDG